MSRGGLRTPLARARGLGSAKEGVSHWWRQRLSGIALAPLGIWFVLALIPRIGADHEAIIAWMASPWVALMLVLLVVALLYHAQLGLQVVIEDYVHTEFAKLGLLIATKFLTVVLGLAGVLAVLRVAL